jgi:hypothetical protein
LIPFDPPTRTGKIAILSHEAVARNDDHQRVFKAGVGYGTNGDRVPFCIVSDHRDQVKPPSVIGFR